MVIVHFKSSIGHNNLTLPTLRVLLCRGTQQFWKPNVCIQRLQWVTKNNTFASRSSAWLKTQIWYWETWTWDGRRPWTSAPPASPTPACKNDNCQSTTRKYDMGERNSAEIMKKRTVDFDDWMERENHHIKITNARPGGCSGFLLCC